VTLLLIAPIDPTAEARGDHRQSCRGPLVLRVDTWRPADATSPGGVTDSPLSTPPGPPWG